MSTFLPEISPRKRQTVSVSATSTANAVNCISILDSWLFRDFNKTPVKASPPSYTPWMFSVFIPIQLHRWTGHPCLGDKNYVPSLVPDRGSQSMEETWEPSWLSLRSSPWGQPERARKLGSYMQWTHRPESGGPGADTKTGGLKTLHLSGKDLRQHREIKERMASWRVGPVQALVESTSRLPIPCCPSQSLQPPCDLDSLPCLPVVPHSCWTCMRQPESFIKKCKRDPVTSLPQLHRG